MPPLRKASNAKSFGRLPKASTTEFDRFALAIECSISAVTEWLLRMLVHP
jgi:hypothetical protein